MNLTAIDMAGHVCELALVIGMFAIAKGYPAGWALRLVGSAGWIAVALALAAEGVLLTSLILWPLLFIVVDIYGISKWRD